LESANGTLTRALSCPMLILLAAVFGFSYSYIDNINPLPGVIMGFFGLGGDILGTVITAISVVLSLGAITKVLILFSIFILVGAFIIGFFMSGYMNLLKTAVLDGKVDNKAFLKGIKVSFGRSIKSAFLLIFTSVFIFLVVIVAALPALSTMWSAFNGKSEALPLAIFLSLITAFAIFFVLLFYNVYVVFWYPAISLGYIKFISISKRIIDNSFFEVAGKVFMYTVEFLLITVVSILIRSFFNSAFQNLAIFVGLIILEGALFTLWFLRLTSYTTSVFAFLARKYKNL